MNARTPAASRATACRCAHRVPAPASKIASLGRSTGRPIGLAAATIASPKDRQFHNLQAIGPDIASNVVKDGTTE